MPLYEFRCGNCRAEFEALCRDSRAEGAACPECGGQELLRLISRFAMSRQLTPCGTPAADAAGSCGYNARTGGCANCEF
jgi:putative FmdB family regulatory protein